jgi:spermidine synthase
LIEDEADPGDGTRPARRGDPLTYYYRNGPVGHLFATMGNDPRLERVGIVGLGSGSMAAYARPGQHWTYFEIDPAVARIAQDPNLFTFYSDAVARGVQLDTVFGDARLTLEGTHEQFGLIVIDAFSSDAIPVHLLTREALQVYFRRLQPRGFLAFNVSNRYLDLEPVLAALAHDAGGVCLWEDDRFTNPKDEKKGKTKSQWVVVARSAEDLPPLRKAGGLWAPIAVRVSVPVWTDDFSNLFQVFRPLENNR